MNKKILFLTIGLFSFLLAGCSLPNKQNKQLVGGDKDVHGCIGSAGYTWCEPKQKCLREWEEPCTGQAVFDLLTNLKNSTGIDFSGIGQTNIQWLTETDPLTLQAKSISASGIADTNLDQINNFFESQGFSRDNYNNADSPTAGMEGWLKGNIGCQVFKEYTDVDDSNPNAPVEVLSDVINVTVSCAELD